jgi:hypothetical protein
MSNPSWLHVSAVQQLLLACKPAGLIQVKAIYTNLVLEDMHGVSVQQFVMKGLSWQRSDPV